MMSTPPEPPSSSLAPPSPYKRKKRTAASPSTPPVRSAMNRYSLRSLNKERNFLSKPDFLKCLTQGLDVAEKPMLITGYVPEANAMPIVYMNKAFTELSKYNSEEAFGVDVLFIKDPMIPDNDADAAAEEKENKSVASFRKFSRDATDKSVRLNDREKECRGSLSCYTRDGRQFTNKVVMKHFRSDKASENGGGTGRRSGSVSEGEGEGEELRRSKLDADELGLDSEGDYFFVEMQEVPACTGKQKAILALKALLFIGFVVCLLAILYNSFADSAPKSSVPVKPGSGGPMDKIEQLWKDKMTSASHTAATGKKGIMDKIEKVWKEKTQGGGAQGGK